MSSNVRFTPIFWCIYPRGGGAITLIVHYNQFLNQKRFLSDKFTSDKAIFSDIIALPTKLYTAQNMTILLFLATPLTSHPKMHYNKDNIMNRRGVKCQI